MPRPGGMNVAEKSEDFKGSMIRLFQNLNTWRKYFIIALLLAFLSAVLSTIAPNRLAGITDVISDGIKPDTEKLWLITSQIKQNIGENPYMLSEDYVIDDITIDGVVISAEDQMTYMYQLQNIDQEHFLEAFDSFPASIKSLIEPKLDMDTLKTRITILAIIYLLGSIFAYCQEIIMAYISTGYSKKMRKDISYKINRLPLAYFDHHESGDVVSRVTNDVDSIGINIGQSVSSFIGSLTLFLGSVIMMFVTNWIMAFTAILASILGFVGSFILLKKSQKYFVERQERLGELNGHIEEIYAGHNVVKAYNGEDEALEEFDKINTQLYDCNRKSQFLSGIMQPMMGFVGNFGYVAVCVVGALLVMNDKTTFGVIVAFMIYVRLFTNPLSQMAQAATSMQSVAAAAERVFEFLDETELPNEKALTSYVDPKKAKGEVDFKNVRFGYSDDKVIIKDFSAHIKAGEKVAIVGPTGAGKTTMVNLLMKFYDINDGDIQIDGISIKELKRENISDLFVMVLQDTWLFDGTIRDNILYNRKNVSDEELWKVCEIVGIDHFIKNLPNGLNSSVTDNEVISSGQKQLLTIARGMMEEAPFLILDEATSNVDTRTEELVQKAMDKLMEGKTSFIIAHRLSTIKNADLILVMDDGNIVEQGKHDDLIKKNGFYAKLYNSQFQK